jgi:hypothetical protein
MRMRNAALAAALLLLPACGGDVAPVSPASPLPDPPRATLSTLPPGDAAELDASYEVVVTRTGESAVRERWEWRLWRREGLVESLESRGNTGEAWQRDASGRLIGCDRIFHTEKRVIELMPGDLAALDVARDWVQVGSLVDPRRLGRELRKTGTTHVAGRAAEVYEGKIGAAACAVDWVPSLRLPSRLRRTRGDETILFTLREVHAAGKSPWPRPDASGYLRNDYADIGDMPTDPFMRRFAHGHGPVHPGHEDH